MTPPSSPERPREGRCCADRLAGVPRRVEEGGRACSRRAGLLPAVVCPTGGVAGGPASKVALTGDSDAKADVDGDGFADLVVGGHHRVFSPATRSPANWTLTLIFGSAVGLTRRANQLWQESDFRTDPPTCDGRSGDPRPAGHEDQQMQAHALRPRRHPPVDLPAGGHPVRSQISSRNPEPEFASGRDGWGEWWADFLT